MLNKKILIGGGIGLLILTIIFFAVYFGFPQQEVFPELPSGTFVEKVTGDFICKNTGGYVTNPIEVQMNLVKGSFFSPGYSYATYFCEEDNGEVGCLASVNAQCGTALFGGQRKAYYAQSEADIINWDVKATNNLPDEIKLNQGEERKFYVTCEGQEPTSSLVLIKQAENAIYLISPGYGCSNCKIKGSQPNCEFISSNQVLQYKNAQEIGNDQIQIGTKLKLGDTKSTTVGWRESPTLGNIQQYNGKNVLCRPSSLGANLFELKTTTTIGGDKYLTQGSLLKSGSGICCDNAQCSGDMVCENFECKLKPVTCDFGTCNQIERGNILSQTEQIRNSKFYLVTESCGQDLCLQEKTEEIDCTKNYCKDEFGEDFFCDYQEGCIEIKEPEPTPAGYCSKEGGKWIAKECAEGLECCFGEVTSDPYLGKCLTTCESVPHCGNNVCEPDKGETLDSCPQDCSKSLECEWFQEKYEKDVGTGFLGLGRIVGSTTLERGCKTASWVWFLLIVGILLFVIFIISLMKGDN